MPDSASSKFNEEGASGAVQVLREANFGCTTQGSRPSKSSFTNKPGPERHLLRCAFSTDPRVSAKGACDCYH